MSTVDCSEHGGNGGGCMPLRVLNTELGRIRARQDHNDARWGEIAAAVGEARTAAIEARNESKRSGENSVLCREALERIEARFYAPANEALVKYQSEPPDDDLGEITKVDIRRPVHTSRRLRAVEKQRNWVAIIAGGSAAIVAVIEAIARSGIFK